ncbi:MAG: hypothetical protein QM627_07485 [Luteolibacter sp.]
MNPPIAGKPSGIFCADHSINPSAILKTDSAGIMQHRIGYSRWLNLGEHRQKFGSSCVTGHFSSSPNVLAHPPRAARLDAASCSVLNIRRGRTLGTQISGELVKNLVVKHLAGTRAGESGGSEMTGMRAAKNLAGKTTNRQSAENLARVSERACVLKNLARRRGLEETSRSTWNAKGESVVLV